MRHQSVIASVFAALGASLLAPLALAAPLVFESGGDRANPRRLPQRHRWWDHRRASRLFRRTAARDQLGWRP